MLMRQCPEIRRPGCNKATEAKSGSTGHKAITDNSVGADSVNIGDGGTERCWCSKRWLPRTRSDLCSSKGKMLHAQ